MADDPYADLLKQHLSGGSASSSAAAAAGGGATDPYTAKIGAFSSQQTQPPPSQMQGWQREVALPASNVARGFVSLFGLPGDALQGTEYLAGQRAQQALNPDPITAARSFQTVDVGSPPRITTPQMLAASPDKPNVPAWSGDNPATTTALLSYPGIRDIANRPDLQPQNLREKIEAGAAQGVGASLPILLTGGGTAPAALKTLAQGAAGGAGGTVGGDLGQAVGGEPGRILGTLGTSLLAARMAPGGGGPLSLVPKSYDAETTALLNRANDMGFNISVGQASNNPFIKYVDSFARRMPLSGYSRFDAANQAAVNRNAAASFGETADKITPDVLNNAYSRIGQVFENIGGRYDVKLDPTLDASLAKVHQQAGEVGLDAGQTLAIQNQIQKIRDIAAQNGGAIPGNVYVNLTKRGESLDRLQGSRSTTAGQLGGDIRDALDQALQRAATPEDAAALREARTQYKAMKTVEPLTMSADVVGGARPSTGDINAQLLRGRVLQQYQNAPRAAVGDIPLKDVAQIGSRFLREPSTSGTGERLTIGRIGEALAAAMSPFAGEHLMGVPPETGYGILAGTILAPRIASSALRAPALPPTSPLAASLMGAYPQLVAPTRAGGGG